MPTVDPRVTPYDTLSVQELTEEYIRVREEQKALDERRVKIKQALKRKSHGES